MAKKRRKFSKVQTTEFYRMSNLFDKFPNISYHCAFGERSNGKTFSALEECINMAKDIIDGKSGAKFMYVRRLHTHITRANMKKLFSEDPNLYDYMESVLGTYIEYSTEYGFYVTIDEKVVNVGYVNAVEDAFMNKGIPLGTVEFIFFDEFLDYFYMENEIELFLHLMSTVTRHRENVRIFMSGNTVSRFCPYFDLFGVDHKKIKHGDIAVVKHKAGTSIVVERTKSLVKEYGTKTKKHKYLGFDDNPSVNMILYGDWEHKKKEVTGIDGVTWSCMRYLVPVAITAIGDVYELSLSVTDKISKDNPILFVRKINTQQGKISAKILYHLAYDDSITLFHEKTQQFVPTYKRISSFWGEDVLHKFDIVKECVRVGRVVYSNFETGTEFEKIFEEFV